MLVTGASSGIGRSCAQLFSESGAQVILLGRNEDRLKETHRSLKGDGHNFYSVDLTNFDAVEQFVDQLKQSYPTIHGLVNAAGITLTYPFKLVKPDKLEHYFKTNVYSVFHLTRLITKSFTSDAGMSVVFISSVMASVGEKAKSVYSMTKGALLSGSRSLALELSEKNIRVNCVSPGVVDTPMTENAAYRKSEEAFNEIKKKHPLGTLDPQDIAYACHFLLSDASRHITGIDLKVDSGYTAQ